MKTLTILLLAILLIGCEQPPQNRIDVFSHIQSLEIETNMVNLSLDSIKVGKAMSTPKIVNVTPKSWYWNGTPYLISNLMAGYFMNACWTPRMVLTAPDTIFVTVENPAIAFGSPSPWRTADIGVVLANGRGAIWKAFVTNAHGGREALWPKQTSYHGTKDARVTEIDSSRQYAAGSALYCIGELECDPADGNYTVAVVLTHLSPPYVRRSLSYDGPQVSVGISGVAF